MPTTLNLSSQAVAVYDGGDDFATSGPLVSGDFDAMMVESHSAMRFELPEGFDPGTDLVTSAVLSIWGRRKDSEEEPTAGQRHQVGILASGSQTLPTTKAGVQSAAVGTVVRTIGTGSYSPALDETVGTAFGWVTIDLTAAMEEARESARLSGGWVVVLVKPLNYEFGAHVEAQGLTQANLPTISFDWDLAPTQDLNLDAVLDPLTLEAELFAANGVFVDAVLDPIGLAADAVLFGQADLVATLDSLSIDCQAIQGVFLEVELEASLASLSLDAYLAAGSNANLDAVLDPLTLESRAVLGSRVRFGLLADGPRDASFSLFA